MLISWDHPNIQSTAPKFITIVRCITGTFGSFLYCKVLESCACIVKARTGAAQCRWAQFKWKCLIYSFRIGSLKSSKPWAKMTNPMKTKLWFSNTNLMCSPFRTFLYSCLWRFVHCQMYMSCLAIAYVWPMELTFLVWCVCICIVTV